MIPDNVAEELAVIYGEQPPQTPEPEPEPETTPEPEPEMRLLGGVVYRVQPGETPQSIALSVYGDAAHAAALVEHNQRAGLLINDNLTVNGLILLP